MSTAVELAPLTGIAVACAGLGVSRATFYGSGAARKYARWLSAWPALAHTVGPQPDRARDHQRAAARAGVCRPQRTYRLCPPARWRPLFGLRLHLLPHPARRGRGPTAAQPTAPPAVRQAATVGDRAPAAVVVGYHQIEGPRQVGVLPPVRHLGRVQSLCRRLDARRTRIGRARQQLIAATCDKEAITQDQLTLHADRGTSMRSSRSRCCSAILASPRAMAAPR